MRRIRPFLARAAALVGISGIAMVTVLTSATPASASTPTCAGTSIVLSAITNTPMRVPTVGNDTPNQYDCNLGLNDSSTAVARLQIDLNYCQGDHLTVDGIYGPLTQAAVTALQKRLGTTADGIYGPNTIDAGFSYEVVGGGSCGVIPGT